MAARWPFERLPGELSTHVVQESEIQDLRSMAMQLGRISWDTPGRLNNHSRSLLEHARQSLTVRYEGSRTRRHHHIRYACSGRSREAVKSVFS